MGAPIETLKKMRDDAHVLALIASVDDAPFTPAVLDAVADWFEDVEISYPIAEMAFEGNERRKLVHTVANELLEFFAVSVNRAESQGGELSDADFAVLAERVDPLWRELAGAFAIELNERFNDNRVPAEHSQSYLKHLVERFAEDQGEEAAAEFRDAIRNDSRLRAQLRRMGLDPDAA